MEKIDFVNNTTPALNMTNLNKLQDNVEDAIEEVVLGGDTLPIYSIVDYDGATVPDGYQQIIDNGTNANGNWVKYDNGIMICYHKIEGSSFNCTQSGGSGRYYYVDANSSSENAKTWTYPQTFISSPNVSLVIGSSGYTMSGLTTVTTTSCTGVCVMPYSNTDMTFRWYFTAIGRWK